MNLDKKYLNMGVIYAVVAFLSLYFTTQEIYGSVMCSLLVMLLFFFISSIAAWEKQLYQNVKTKNTITPINNFQSNRNWQQEWEESKLRRKKATYDHIINVHNMKKKSVTSVDDGVAKFSHIFNVGDKAARPFFQNQHVQSILGYSSSQTSFSKTSSGNIQAKKIDENFWDNVSKNISDNQAKSDEICAAPGCSIKVSAFDFRCFKCRKRFCPSCEEGKSILCKACS